MIRITGHTHLHTAFLQDLGAVMRDGYWAIDELTTFQQSLVQTRGLLVQQWGVDLAAPPVRKPPKQSIMIGDDQTMFGRFGDVPPIAFAGFSSLFAFADYVEKIGRNKTEIDNIRNGWSDGIGSLPRLKADIAINKRRLPSMSGGHVNVGKLLAGNPIHMQRKRKAPNDRFITLFVSICNLKTVSNANLLVRALYLSSIIDLLETNDYRCQIYACDASNNFAGETLGEGIINDTQLFIKVKSFHERMSISEISFALGHPGMGYMRNSIFLRIPELKYIRGKYTGLHSRLFDKSDYTDDEYFIPSLMKETNDKMSSDPGAILDILVPERFPIKIIQDDR